MRNLYLSKSSLLVGADKKTSLLMSLNHIDWEKVGILCFIIRPIYLGYLCNSVTLLSQQSCDTEK